MCHMVHNVGDKKGEQRGEEDIVQMQSQADRVHDNGDRTPQEVQKSAPTNSSNSNNR